MPTVDRVLPTALWERFCRQFARATGLRLGLFEAGGDPLPGASGSGPFCPGEFAPDGESCAAAYRKAAQQAAGSGDATLFRCPHGFLIFAAPVVLHGDDADSAWVLLGGPALTEPIGNDPAHEVLQRSAAAPEALAEHLATVPVVAPRQLLEQAHLAEMCLRAVIQGYQQKETFSRRHSQVMTLFDVSSDLSMAASEHELYALALNILGVLFDVECAAVLLSDGHNGGYRVHTAMGDLEKSLLSWTLSAAPDLAADAAAGTVMHLDEPHLLGKLGLPEEVERWSGFRLGGEEGRDGILALINCPLADHEEQMVRGFSLQLSLVMQKQQLRTLAEERARELRAVQETSRQFVACLEPEQLFDVVLEEARKITGARKGSLMLAAAEGEELSVKAVTGMNGTVVQKLRVRSGQGIAGRVFSTGEPIVVHDIEQDGRFQRRNRPRYATKSFCSIPIAVEGRVVGVLNVSDKLSGEIFDEADLKLLQTMATQATIAIERSSYYAQSRELRKISITDPLTGLLNRRYFQERLAEEVDRSTRHAKPLSLMMVDVDHFKLYNDTNGHPAGDKALVMLARTLRESVRTIDVVSRFGGEEFAVILPETRKEEAAEIGERLRAEIEAVYFPGEEALPAKRLTVSLGIAAFPEDARDLKSLIQRSDRALYQAKAQGRNLIVSYASTRPREAASGEAWTKLL